MTVFSPTALQTFLEHLLSNLRVPPDDAHHAARMFVDQEMRGVRTHGLRMLDRNLRGLKSGWINPLPRRQAIVDRDGVAVLDGDHGLGMIGCRHAMRLAIDKAKRDGIGVALICNNHHFLAAAPHCLQAAGAGLIGIAMSNTNASMGYPGTGARAIANSPIGFAIPTAAGFPIVFDSALTTSGGKLEQFIRDGLRIPGNLLGLDSTGHPSDDPAAVLHGGTPLPIGGHKGAGLAVLVEVLTGVLSGGAFLKQIVSIERRRDKHQAESQCCIAIDVAHFMPVDRFEKRMADFIADLKDNPLAPGETEITVPGERMHRHYQRCQRDGISIDDDLLNELNQWARELAVPLPPPCRNL